MMSAAISTMNASAPPRLSASLCVAQAAARLIGELLRCDTSAPGNACLISAATVDVIRVLRGDEDLRDAVALARELLQRRDREVHVGGLAGERGLHCAHDRVIGAVDRERAAELQLLLLHVRVVDENLVGRTLREPLPRRELVGGDSGVLVVGVDVTAWYESFEMFVDGGFTVWRMVCNGTVNEALNSLARRQSSNAGLPPPNKKPPPPPPPRNPPPPPVPPPPVPPLPPPPPPLPQRWIVTPLSARHCWSAWRSASVSGVPLRLRVGLAAGLDRRDDLGNRAGLVLHLLRESAPLRDAMSCETWPTASCGNEISDTDKKKSCVNLVPGLPSFEVGATLLLSLSNAVVSEELRCCDRLRRHPRRTRRHHRHQEPAARGVRGGRGGRRIRRRGRAVDARHHDVGADRRQRCQNLFLRIVEPLRHADDADHHADADAGQRGEQRAPSCRNSRPMYVRENTHRVNRNRSWSDVRRGKDCRRIPGPAPGACRACPPSG